MSGLKLEVGKHYRMRDGQKVTITGLTGDDDNYPFRGCNGFAYTTDGYYWRSGEEGPRDLISEWTGAPTGPVRAVTRKEIVPGTYGMVQVREPREGSCFVNLQLREYSVAELRAAIATLTEIAEALEAPAP